jgi:methionyl-tRNA formyltransferase
MRVVFMGTPEFAVPSLKTLLAGGCDVCAVVTQPDRPAGRGRRVQSSPVKLLAEAGGVPVYQPEKVRDPRHHEFFESCMSDFLVVVAFGQILPAWLLELPKVAAVNVHASLLPRYRGAAPINWAIMNGETTSGVTTMLMEERLDSGPILLQKVLPIPPEMTAGQLAERLAREGADLLMPTLEALRDGTLHGTIQDESRASYAPRITKEMAPVAWKQAAVQVHNLIRALNPWPLAHTEFRGQKLQLFSSRADTGAARSDGKPGCYLGSTREGMRIQCGDGAVLELLEVQLAGKGRVSGRDFANGARLKPGDILFPSADS